MSEQSPVGSNQTEIERIAEMGGLDPEELAGLDIHPPTFEGRDGFGDEQPAVIPDVGEVDAEAPLAATEDYATDDHRRIVQETYRGLDALKKMAEGDLSGALTDMVGLRNPTIIAPLIKAFGQELQKYEGSTANMLVHLETLREFVLRIPFVDAVQSMNHAIDELYRERIAKQLITGAGRVEEAEIMTALIISDQVREDCILDLFVKSGICNDEAEVKRLIKTHIGSYYDTQKLLQKIDDTRRSTAASQTPNFSIGKLTREPYIK